MADFKLTQSGAQIQADLNRVESITITSTYITDGNTTFNASNKQPLIDSSNKLSADLVSDSAATNKFVTSEQVAAINTIGDKASKVSNATAGNFAGLDSNGNLTDSGYDISDFLQSEDVTAGTAATINADTLQGHTASYFQEKLIAGTNITIADDGKTISVTGGGSSNITVSSTGVTDTSTSVTYNASDKQDALSSTQLTACNSGIDSTKVTQITTNQTNITTINNSDVMNSGITSSKVATYDGYAATISSKLDATKCTYQTTAPTAAISDGGVHIVYLTSDPATKYDGYIYLIKEN